MRAIANYIEGAVSAFTLFPEHEPVLQMPVRRTRMTLSEAMSKDREALRGDFKKAMELVREQR
ncbi:MAG: hypothetical protein RL318_2208 [Fibrobacterota bacterium]|jgi:hypothetical protein